MKPLFTICLSQFSYQVIVEIHMTVAIINVDMLWINIFRVIVCSTNVIVVLSNIGYRRYVGKYTFQVLLLLNVIEL